LALSGIVLRTGKLRTLLKEVSFAIVSPRRFIIGTQWELLTFMIFSRIIYTMTIWTDAKHDEWAELSIRTLSFVDKLTERNDILITIEPDLRDYDLRVIKPRPAAWFVPSKAEMFFTANALFDDGLSSVENVNPASIVSQRNNPVYIGAVFHESSHARYTTYTLPPLPAHINRWVTLLEEPRCEGKLLQEFPQYKNYVKAIASHIVAKGFFNDEKLKGKDELARRFEATELAILLLARAHNGVFENDDVSACTQLVSSTLGKKDFDAIEELYIHALSLEAEDMDELIEIAESIHRIVDRNNEAADNSSSQQNQSLPCGSSMPAPPSASSQDSTQPGSSSGNPDDEPDESKPGDASKGDSSDSENKESDESESGEGSASKDSKVSDGSNDNSITGGSGEKEETEIPDATIHPAAKGWGNSVNPDDVLRDIAAASEQAKKEIENGALPMPIDVRKNVQQENKDHRKDIAKDKEKIRKGAKTESGTSFGNEYDTIRIRDEAPTNADIARSRAIYVAIEKAQFRDISRTVIASQLPPGRLSIRQTMNRAAQIASRQEITATPWNQTRRREIDNPPITLAIATDASGSMGIYQREVSSFTWAFANAVSRLKGKVGAVAWNIESHELIAPNKRYEKIPVSNATGGSTGLPNAIYALDGLMNLSFGEGVRVLAIITDGSLPTTSQIQRKIDKLSGYGVQIIWILTKRNGWKPRNATIAVLDRTDDFGRIVGQKVIEMLGNS
jgi:hypothetical protein